MPDTQTLQFSRHAWNRILRHLPAGELHTQLWREVRPWNLAASVTLDDERAAVVLEAARCAGVEVRD